MHGRFVPRPAVTTVPIAGRLQMVELHPDLQTYLRDGWISHPLFQVDHWKPGDNRRINTLYEHRRQLAESAREANDWDTFIALHRPTEREMAFHENCDQMNRSDYYRIGGDIWTDPEIIRSGSCFVASINNRLDDFSIRREIMSNDELEQLESLDDRFQVYRSHLDWNRDGCCWTLNPDIAIEFARGYDWPCLTTATVAKSDVLAFFERRGESEIIVHPTSIDKPVTKPVLAAR